MSTLHDSRNAHRSSTRIPAPHPLDTAGTSAHNVSVNLRLSPAMLEQIDLTVGSRRLKTPRNRWILEAICEKLDRETEAHEIRIAEDRMQALLDGRSSTTPLREVMEAHGLAD